MDWSELSDRAFRLAASLAGEYDAELAVLYVVPLPALMYGPPPADYLDHMLDELRRVTPGDPRIRVRHLVAEGDPATAILRAARDNKCDLIVMATHGRYGLNRLLKGSVAEEVVRMAACPVLTLNTEAPAGAQPGQLPGTDGARGVS